MGTYISLKNRNESFIPFLYTIKKRPEDWGSDSSGRVLAYQSQGHESKSHYHKKADLTCLLE
jgi:hypothetical protein